jgi:hypothetical protein
MAKETYLGDFEFSPVGVPTSVSPHPSLREMAWEEGARAALEERPAAAVLT